jgi:nucleoside-diphosphate-sugar epimerase
MRPGRLRVLVTGASGLVGREMCGVLADRGHAVVALLHHSRTLERNDGAAVSARLFDGAHQGGVVTVLDGDVTAERFGLTVPVSGALAASVDVIAHCAAVTAFNLPRSTYDRVNVGGTAQVLAFAAQAGRHLRVLHVSTAYVCGEADGVVPEAPTAASRFNNGYEASKAAAEALVLAAHRHGQPVAIARPAIVAGNWESGAIGAFGSMYQLVRLVTKGRTGALPAWPDASLNLVPIDHVAAALTDIAERMGLADGRIFHLAAGDPVPLTVLEALAAEFPSLRAPHLIPPERFDMARLSPRQQLLHATVTANYSCYLRPSPHFVTANLIALSGRCCPATDGDYVRRLVRYAVATGFLPGRARFPSEPEDFRKIKFSL